MWMTELTNTKSPAVITEYRLLFACERVRSYKEQLFHDVRLLQLSSL